MLQCNAEHPPISTILYCITYHYLDPSVMCHLAPFFVDSSHRTSSSTLKSERREEPELPIHGRKMQREVPSNFLFFSFLFESLSSYFVLVLVQLTPVIKLALESYRPSKLSNSVYLGTLKIPHEYPKLRFVHSHSHPPFPE